MEGEKNNTQTASNEDSQENTVELREPLAPDQDVIEAIEILPENDQDSFTDSADDSENNTLPGEDESSVSLGDVGVDTHEVSENAPQETQEPAEDTLEEAPISVALDASGPTEEAHHNYLSGDSPAVSAPSTAPANSASGGSFGAMLMGAIVTLGLIGTVQYFDQGWPFANAQQQEDAVLSSFEDLQGQTQQELGVLADQITKIEQRQSQNSSGLETRLAAMDQLGARLDQFAAQMNGIETQLAALGADLEKTQAQVASQTSAPDVADLEALKSEFTELFSTVEGVQGIISEQAALRQAAQEQSRFDKALRQAALAMEEGSPFLSALSEFDALGLSVSEELRSAARSGSQTRGDLRDSFAQIARDALALDRQVSLNAEGENSGGVLTFFKNQIGLRSVTVREGDDVDAVLSRAEDALKRDDLQEAVAELSNITAPANEAVAPWMMAAQLRMDLEAALATLSLAPPAQ